MSFCSRCGKELPPGATFCAYCGALITGPGPSAGTRTKFCQHCGAQITFEAEICPKCGVRVAGPQLVETISAAIRHELKNPGIAAVLSFFFVGLGQIYNGQIGKGIGFIVLGVVFVALMFVLIGFILYPVFWAYNIYDAYNTAKKINARP
jgi:TM2 domain-containing membrane protein YozV